MRTFGARLIVDQVRKFPPLKANGPVSRILFFWVYCPKKGQEIRVSEHLSVQNNSNVERRRYQLPFVEKRQITGTINMRPHDDRNGPGGWRRGGEDAATMMSSELPSRGAREGGGESSPVRVLTHTTRLARCRRSWACGAGGAGVRREPMTRRGTVGSSRYRPRHCCHRATTLLYI